ncbi:DCC1-like thiol-disulfide oxidoreductase family protein [Candidatus Synechococcus calcipolaris G9]|uniref:DCC1-like thiol-disulfide oxidoreductase family protein n=1 Tax=Candidatus Synechococcus calcipolaris G9 TaxID=1497997 RepID=A0ABT6F0F3_9SYNE|nr:DCC1-like thiol-disulfide oxidoreductase family protein [Candidatus Synechococcus calcipolaris]MDG2991320.1 DCC1-like thiol-disulfide oxidoreductase family protein [Candidatus Synechococcus calcipolaris G9]
MNYVIIYDGLCNLCVTFVRLLQQVDQSNQFAYVPMQAEAELERWQITPENCQGGMIILEGENPENRWQGSDAAEKIISLLPAGDGLMQVYRAVPWLKPSGDYLYGLIRDHRYEWFGQRQDCYGGCDRPRE